MNGEGHRVQQIGAQAEQRVVDIAMGLGFVVERSLGLDHGRKTDCVIQGHPVQVSANGKSRRARNRLGELGISCLVAGPHITDEALITSIFCIINNTQPINY